VKSFLCRRMSIFVDLRSTGAPPRGSWGVVDSTGSFTMFRRAKIWLDAVPDKVIRAAIESDVLAGPLGLTDDLGWPLCASVRPPRIMWSSE
jgi:hypothetical protein